MSNFQINLCRCVCIPAGTESFHKLFSRLYDPLLLGERKSKTQQVLLSCLTANAQAWPCVQKVRKRVPLPPLSSTCGGRRTASSQKAQDSGKSWWLCSPFTRTSRGDEWSIGKNVCVCGSKLWVVAGVSACLHQSAESTQKRPQLKKSPHPTSRAPRSFSHKHAIGIFSCSVFLIFVPSAAQAHQMNKTFIKCTGAVVHYCLCNKYGSMPGKPNDYICL